MQTVAVCGVRNFAYYLHRMLDSLRRAKLFLLGFGVLLVGAYCILFAVLLQLDLRVQRRLRQWWPGCDRRRWHRWWHQHFTGQLVLVGVTADEGTARRWFHAGKGCLTGAQVGRLPPRFDGGGRGARYGDHGRLWWWWCRRRRHVVMVVALCNTVGGRL